LKKLPEQHKVCGHMKYQRRYRISFASIALGAFCLLAGLKLEGGSAMTGKTLPRTEPVALGKLDPFWRYSAALGPFLEGGQALTEIPEYVLHSDFPYAKRPFAMEVPFADHLSIVRLLGGYYDGGKEGQPDLKVRERDLVYRDGTGHLAYRWDLLRARLQPYLANGYTNLTLVLDNLPYCFPKEPRYGSYGQAGPPVDFKEWHAFITALCLELKSMLGNSANQLRFRVGTENNGRERFDGTMAEFLQHYDHAAAAVKEVLPGAKFGAFNISGANLKGIEKIHNVNAFQLAEHCQRARLAGGNLPIPFDWVAYSRYFRPGDSPEVSARGCREIWEEFERRVPQIKGVSREIHEFGIAPFGEVAKGQFVSAEPGALGAAMTCQMMLFLREAGINRLWHWGVQDAFRDRKNKLQHLFTGPAWVMSVLEQMRGGEAWLLFPENTSPTKTLCIGILSRCEGKTIVLVAAYNTDLTQHGAEKFQLTLPKGVLLPSSGLRQVRMNRDTAVHDQIRRDLTTAKLLNPEFVTRPDRVGNIRQMGVGRPAEQLVGDRLEQYQKAWIKSLTLQTAGSADAQMGERNLVVTLAPPEILVLVGK
jgi:hypothetical protein